MRNKKSLGSHAAFMLTILFVLGISSCCNSSKATLSWRKKWIGDAGLTKKEEPPKEEPPIAEEAQKDLEDFDPIDFFKDAVYCGDSCMSHYHWRGNSYLHPEIFGKHNAAVWLANGSYGVQYAHRDVSTLTATEKTYCPKYKGSICNLWDAISALEKKRVIMFFGLNDIGPSGVDLFIEHYIEVIEKIKEKVPDAKFYILSVTPMRKDMQIPGKLCTENILKANERLEQMCVEYGWTFVDVASKLRDKDGHMILSLPDGTQISDGTNVHLMKEAYVFWDEALEKTAREELKKEYYEE